MRYTKAIAREMAKRKLSEKDLAKLAGVTERQVRYLMMGSLRTHLRTLAAVSVALGMYAELKMSPASVLDKMIEPPGDPDDNDEELRRVLRM